MENLDELVYDYLKENPLTMDELVESLYKNYSLKEKDIKLSVQRLRYMGKICPNNRWQLSCTPDIKL